MSVSHLGHIRFLSWTDLRIFTSRLSKSLGISGVRSLSSATFLTKPTNSPESNHIPWHAGQTSTTVDLFVNCLISFAHAGHFMLDILSCGVDYGNSLGDIYVLRELKD